MPTKKQASRKKRKSQDKLQGSLGIRTLRVKNFKSLKDLNIELGPFNVLVGPNNAGKSNILDALIFIYDRARYGLPQALQHRRGGFRHVFWKGLRDEIEMQISMKAILPSSYGRGLEPRENHTWNYIIGIATGPTTETYELAQEKLTHDTPRKRDLLCLEYVHALHIPERRGPALRISGNIEWTIEPPINPWLESIHSNMLNSAFPFAHYLNCWAFYHLNPGKMKQENTSIKAEKLEGLGDNLAARLNTMRGKNPEAFERIEKTLRGLDGIERILLEPTAANTIFLSWREKGLKDNIPSWAMPDGLLSLLAILTIRYDPNPPPLLCFEEPENYLHPRLIQLLVDNLRALSKNTQVILTTHSPSLVSCLKPEELIIVEKENGATQCTKVGSDKILRAIANNPDLSLGELWQAGHLGGVP